MDNQPKTFEPFKQTKVTIDNPLGRKYNCYGGAEDILDHDWTHNNITFSGEWQRVAEAFVTLTPFVALGWDDPSCPTKTVSRWWYAKSPVSDSYLVSFETKGVAPEKFLQFVATKYNLTVRCQSFKPFSNQVVTTFQPQE